MHNLERFTATSFSCKNVDKKADSCCETQTVPQLALIISTILAVFENSGG